MSSSSTSINPFTVPLGHAPRPNCQCESCTRTRILAMKDGRIIADHLDKINEQCRAAFKQKEAIDRRLRFIEGIVAAAGVLHISH